VFDAVAAVSLLRHHVAHRPGFHRRQFFFVDGGHDGLLRLNLRASRQNQIAPFDGTWKIGMGGCRVITDRRPHFRIPKVRVRCGGPRAFYKTHKTVLAFDGRFETLTPKNQDLCIA
jgi:hypothetical protein